VHEVLRSPGEALDPGARRLFGSRFGYDFSRVRVHADSTAAESARSVNSLAYTVGEDVVFARGQYNPTSRQGRHLLGHELTHVMQQGRRLPAKGPLRIAGSHDGAEREARDAGRAVSSEEKGALGGAAARFAVAGPVLQRYETGEHDKFGETGDDLQKEVSNRSFSYTVQAGEMPDQIAKKFNITEHELRVANSGLLKRWKSVTDPKKSVEGFNAGTVIAIPPVLNDVTKEALKTKELTFIVNGVTLEYGQGVTLGDFYESDYEMMAAAPSELEALSKLIKQDKSGPPVTTAEWEKATGGKYLKLAQKNATHFAPPNESFAPDSGKHPSNDNHKDQWEMSHSHALSKSMSGDRDAALATNAFADHFLTDAFAAGHLINKLDVMEKFEGNLPKNAKGDEFADSSKAFFDAVTAKAFTGPVKSEFSKYETVETHMLIHWGINSESVFTQLLQGIHMKEPELLENAAAKGVHDTLNSEPTGVPVENEKGDQWDLSGDGTLNAKTLAIGKKAVAQSQLNVLDVFQKAGPFDLLGMYKRVWDFVPKPRAGAGQNMVKGAVTAGTDPKSSSLINAVAGLIKANYNTIISALVAKGIIRKT
jgi:hypothetical protein